MIKRLSNKEVKKLSEVLNINKKDIIDLVEEKYLSVNNKIEYFNYENRWIPTLKNDSELKVFKKIIVDKGAVRFIVNGADVMRPGIKNIEEGIISGEIIVILEETHNKIIALGKSLYNAEEMKSIERGKVIINIHYIGDNVWKL